MSLRIMSARKFFISFVIVIFSTIVSQAYQGDFDSSGLVDWNDLAVVANHWLSNDCGTVPQGNLDSDCDVDFKDFALLAKDWYKVTPKNLYYHVKNLNDSGPDSFADCIAQAEADGKDSVIVFDVGGTISRTSGRFDIYEPNLIVCGSTAPAPGITIDLNNLSTLCRVYGSRIQFVDLKVQNTAVNSDGISLLGGSRNITVERCSFWHCQDEGVGMSGSYGNIVAFSKMEFCGSQPDDGTGGENGRGILITGGSATIVGTYVYHCNRGITINSDGLADLRNCRIDESWNTASGSGFTNAGGNFVFSNVINCVANNNANSGFRWKAPGHFYRSGNTGEGNCYAHQDVVPPDQWLECPDATAVEHTSPITDPGLPFPYWLEDAVTPADGNSIGMGTGIPHCLKASDPGPFNKKEAVNASETLQWKSSQIDSQSHDIYFGTSFADVSNADHSSAEYKGNSLTTNFAPGILQSSTTYFWRIDEIGEFGTWKGDIWRFTTVSAIQASQPAPADQSINIDINADLSWQSGFGADSHDIYFGTNSGEVSNAVHGSAEFKGNQSANSFDPGQMLYWLTYYWRVDEVTTGGTVKGTVWNFTTLKDPTMPAANYFVDPSGSDTNAGTSPWTAWKTIQKAADSLGAGQTVLVLPGTYAETITAVTDGASESKITYLAWHEKGPVAINAAGETFGFKNTGAYVIFDGFEVKNANSNGIIFSSDAADYGIIRNCVSHNNGSDGIQVNSPDNCTVQNCLSYANGSKGIEVIGSADNTSLINCTVYGNNNNGLHFSGSDVTVSNCIVTNNTKWGIYTYSGMIANVDYCDVWSNTSGSYSDLTKTILGGHVINSNPLFENPGTGNFHLQATSPCKNAASDGGDLGYRF